MADMDSLLDRLASKFAQIQALIAENLGFSPTNLTPDQRRELHDAAEEAVEAWSEAENERVSSDMPAGTPLQVLLAQYSEIESQILDERDKDLPWGSEA